MKLSELAKLTGEDEPVLRHFAQLGLIAAAEEDLTTADAERVRLAQSLRRRGVEPDAVGVALRRQKDLFDRYLAQLYPDGDYPLLTLEEASEHAGVDVDLAQRVRDAGGLGGPSERLSHADVDAMRSVALAVEAGFPPDALVQLARVYADALDRVGEAEARLFHFYVHERLRSEGLAEDALDASTTQAIDQLIGLMEPAVLYFHRRGLGRAVRDDLALHLAEDAGLLPPDDQTGRLFAAIGFIDLARFTALTDAMGDAAAIELLNRFSDLVRRCVSRHEGRVVKQIGDAFMLIYGDPRSAVRCALDIRDAAFGEPQFLGTRQGMHWGPVLYREGDYYGATVNLAARIVTEAAADRVLVSAALRDQVAHDDDITFLTRGARSLKNVAEPVEVFEVRGPDDGMLGERTVDPVCGMTIGSDASTVRLQFGDRDVVLCSQACLQRFVARPERYP